MIFETLTPFQQRQQSLQVANQAKYVGKSLNWSFSDGRFVGERLPTFIVR